MGLVPLIVSIPGRDEQFMAIQIKFPDIVLIVRRGPKWKSFS